MGFYAKNFLYDNETSEMYNLQISSIDSNGVDTLNGSGTTTILDKQIYKRIKPFFFGAYFDPKLSFDVSFYSPDEIDGQFLSYIEKWLFGRLSYKTLAIIQPDFDDIYANAVFINPKRVTIGNIIYGFQATCLLDSQFFWTYPKTLTYTFSSPPSGSSIIFYNNSHLEDYLYPQISFTMNSSGGNLTIANSDDNDREFIFTSLTKNEVITLNNDLQIITSSLGTLRLSSFNKNFLRFVPGVNRLTVTGAISSLNITYQFARRL